MTVVTNNYNLLPELPIHRAPVDLFFDIDTLVPQLLDLHADWGWEDLEEFLEEKTRRPVHPEDRTTLRAVWLRCHLAASQG